MTERKSPKPLTLKLVSTTLPPPKIQIKKDYVLKTFHKNYKNIGINEAVFLASLRHPRIQTLTSCRLKDGVMELKMPKGVTDTYQSLPDDKVLCSWMFQALSAVNYLHENDITHGDIKPSNFLLMSDGTLRLIDFELASCNGKNDRTDTAFTVNYRAPEVWEGKWNKPADVWALGATFFRWIYGCDLVPTQKNDTDYKECLKVWSGRRTDSVTCYPPNTFSFFIDFTESKFLLMSMLHTNPTDRRTAKELLESDFFKDFREIKSLLPVELSSNSWQSKYKSYEWLYVKRYTDDRMKTEVADDVDELLNVIATCDK